jgi:hypothetical protein
MGEFVSVYKSEVPARRLLGSSTIWRSSTRRAFVDLVDKGIDSCKPTAKEIGELLSVLLGNRQPSCVCYGTESGSTAAN